MGKNLKVAVIVYHKNLSTLYPEAWTSKFRDSIQRQTWRSFDIYELNYGGTEERIFQESNFESKEFPTFVHGMNYLLDNLLLTGDYDYVFNTNVDDYYDRQRIAKQLVYLRKGYDIVSSNFTLVKENQPDYHHHFNTIKDIEAELDKRHNIIAHPVVAYSRKFWQSNKYNPEEIPAEDYYLWHRAIKTGSKFIILPDFLLFQRIHTNSVCHSQNR